MTYYQVIGQELLVEIFDKTYFIVGYFATVLVVVPIPV